MYYIIIVKKIGECVVYDCERKNLFNKVT
jgi:hypothetical protein